MPSVASETQVLIHRHSSQPRNPGGKNDGETPFEMLLEMGVEPQASSKAYAATSKDKPDTPSASDKPSRSEPRATRAAPTSRRRPMRRRPPTRM